ncbi:ubiquinone biosynthesis protein COQ9, mitochondrial-like isoform X8 [Dreissena polymorpha]|uniref:ubiquinone biosynthesis protein COQ9, mitochondrial-like isoform X4 n=1 Tax=Dreissena polymorpha TaxID=45954 RepID=UPI002263F6E6|nr:ubiquinone biosynthesis protein COQ9, mitochondrial-like isoform X4 [Dreissena polymorpha]XP_052232394.1 ubiquinone biosynthesis protein COQ9, mitochondrial-like isoform X5 [Dreissena polymorpha]XP_052232395.1 ubiquinone biosynthesis protein COQ9, mitochondrial-like isoform X6 [Dreissena polymorpha]XP_052232396.1 ubiquinone biosynthesis protein COQ9, mitochondrial-like isoform X7 [Dreissena polymorpha]XP_052232398.1 ubiquinone biosynthesis protein COQ9, mitochondrial-like isoform X8 [Dreisse
MCQKAESQAGGSEAGDHVSDGEEMEYETRLRILRSSMAFVHQHGWTVDTLAAGAEVEGLPGVAHGLFPRGGVELIYHFYTDCNKQLAMQLAERVAREKESEQTNTPGKSKITPFIRDAVEARLRMIIPYIDRWPQAMGILALPPNAPQALKNLGDLTDEIWYYTGDTSTDFNWYTKRATLGVVYKTTEVFMMQDKSDDYQNTWDFLDRRMGDITRVGKLVRNGQEMTSVLGEACKGFTIIGRNILGANSGAK